MMKYENDSKKFNLFYFVNLFISSLKIKTNYKEVTESLMKEIILRQFNKNLVIIHNIETELSTDQKSIYIYKYDNHYCVVKDYLQLLRKHFNNTNLNYCYKH